MNIILPFASYLVGSIPFGLMIGRLAGIDVRGAGSGNIGATNVARLLGKRLGILTLLLDCLKGYAPMFVASRLLPEGPSRLTVLLLCGVLAVVGHMFPVYLGFRGGKGVATSLGVFLFLSPAAIGISLLVFVAAVALSGFVSAGSLLASALFPLWLLLLGQPAASVLAAAVITMLIWFKHRDNLRRLARGEEKSWKKN